MYKFVTRFNTIFRYVIIHTQFIIIKSFALPFAMAVIHKIKKN